MSQPMGLPRRQSFEPLSTSSTSLASSLSLGKLPSPVFDRFGPGQRSVPAFEASSFHLFVGATRSNSKLGLPNGTNGGSMRSVSGPGTPTSSRSNGIADEGQRTPGGSSLAIGEEVFGFKTVRESASKESLVKSRWNGDDEAAVGLDSTRLPQDSDGHSASNGTTPTATVPVAVAAPANGWPTEPNQLSSRHSVDRLRVKKHRNGVSALGPRRLGRTEGARGGGSGGVSAVHPVAPPIAVAGDVADSPGQDDVLGLALLQTAFLLFGQNRPLAPSPSQRRRRLQATNHHFNTTSSNHVTTMSTTTRPTIKQSGSSIDLRSSVFSSSASGSAKSSPFDNDLVNGSSTSSFASSRPSVPRSKSGLPRYDLSFGERSSHLRSTSPLAASRPAPPAVASGTAPHGGHDTHPGAAEGSPHQQHEGRVNQLSSAASAESFFKFPGGIDYHGTITTSATSPSASASAAAAPNSGNAAGASGASEVVPYSSASSGKNTSAYINTKVPNVPSIRSADPRSLDRSRAQPSLCPFDSYKHQPPHSQQQRHSSAGPATTHSLSPDDLVTGLSSMSLSSNTSSASQKLHPPVLQSQQARLDAYASPPLSLGADWRTAAPANGDTNGGSNALNTSLGTAQMTPYGIYYATTPYISPSDAYYAAQPDATYYAAQAAEPSMGRRDSESVRLPPLSILFASILICFCLLGLACTSSHRSLPLSWGMSALDYASSANSAAVSRHGSFSIPYTPAMSPQPSAYSYNMGAGNHLSATFDHHSNGVGAANGFQPAQQHQIILGRQLRSNAEYIAPGPRNGLQPNLISNGIGTQGIIAYDMARPYGVGYGAGYGAGETMGRALRSQLLDEFRNAKHKHWELSNISGHIVEFSGDQLGSRFIQNKLETASPDEKDMSFQEMLPNLLQLSTDVFANYVVQKFFEQGSQLQKTAMANVLEGHVLELSLQMYGCRVVQKAIEFLLLDQQVRLVKELDGQILKCARDAQANHVIQVGPLFSSDVTFLTPNRFATSLSLQRAIERVPSEKIAFISDACLTNVHMLATHTYGCRVLQRIFEHCPSARSRPLLDELHTCTQHLIQDQYGNVSWPSDMMCTQVRMQLMLLLLFLSQYVVQWVIEKGDAADRSRVVSSLYGSVYHLAQQKFASNVVEKCLSHGNEEEREKLIEEILRYQADGTSTIRSMLVHPFANYVVQSTSHAYFSGVEIITQSTGAQRERVLEETTLQLANLRNYSGTYSKHLATSECTGFLVEGSNI
ncbi:BQ5605_C010g06021 [Microbotryum silenes-dioicae]|uniref:BQ5605_C010g06021 protein n=1 Tax=Microbotryum silenes-dioicae TaxID=796604 RepID=A0A2X0NME0_9BASI|nr:BQ5605_C010g06021 [Microbotryum silenes-dioicae]